MTIRETYMHISEQGMALVKEFEGFSAKAYLCPAGKLTIGYGHVVLPQDGLGEGAIITPQQAEMLLLQDVRVVEAAFARLIKAEISQAAYDALVSLVYNIGVAAFARSTLLKCLNTGNFAGAAAQFDRWVYAAGRLVAGLKRRRAAEKALFLKG